MTSTAGFCQKCGNLLGPNGQFCDKCGTPTEPSAPAPAGISVTRRTRWPARSRRHHHRRPRPYVAPPYMPPPGYGQPPPVGRRRTDSPSRRMVLGIVWVFGHRFDSGGHLRIRRDESRSRQSGGRQSGRGMALAGIVLGLVGVAGSDPLDRSRHRRHDEHQRLPRPADQFDASTAGPIPTPETVEARSTVATTGNTARRSHRDPAGPTARRGMP